MSLKINCSVKTPWHRPSMGVLDICCVSTDETSNTKNTVTHHWATKWPNSTFLKLKVTQTRYGGIYGVQIGNSHCAHLIEEKASRRLFRPLEPKHHVCNRTGKIIQFWCFISKKWRLIKINQIGAFCYLPDQTKNSCNLGRGLVMGGGGWWPIKKKLQHRKWFKKPQRRDRKKCGLWFPNQTLTSEVRVQGEEFFQKGVLRRRHQQSQ